MFEESRSPRLQIDDSLNGKLRILKQKKDDDIKVRINLCQNSVKHRFLF